MFAFDCLFNLLPKMGPSRESDELLQEFPKPCIQGHVVFLVSPEADSINAGPPSSLMLCQSDALSKKDQPASRGAIVAERDVAQEPDDG